MKKVSSKLFNQNKKLAERILKIQGKDYNTWLDAQHSQYIAENQAIIFSALDAFNDEDSSEEESSSKQQKENKQEENTSYPKAEGSLQY